MTTQSSATPTASELARFTKEPKQLAALLGILASLDSDPPTPAKYRQAAVWLDKHVLPEVVTPEAHQRVPKWFIGPWIDSLWHDANPPTQPTPEATADACPLWDRFEFFDHWGVTKVFGVTALLTEPYNISAWGRMWNDVEPGSAVSIIRDVGRRCGGVGIWSPHAAWPSKWTSRVLFFPRPDRFPGILKVSSMRSYYRPDLTMFGSRAIALLRRQPRPDPDHPQLADQLY